MVLRLMFSLRFTFTQHDGKTTLMVRWVPHNATDEKCKTFAANQEGMRQGWTGTMDQLAEYLATARRG